MQNTVTLVKTGETKFSFEYPVTYTKKSPASYIGKLNVTACAELGREGQVMNVKILQITYFEKETRMASDIKSLLEVVAHDFYTQVYHAAKNHAKEKYGKH